MMLKERNVDMEAKGIAVGVRLEHPQQLIDSIQYHNPHGRGKYLRLLNIRCLHASTIEEYIHSACVRRIHNSAASSPGQLVVNGMSPSSRGTRWANSGMVVEILP